MFECIELEFLEFEPPQVTSETNPYFKQLLVSIETVSAQKARLVIDFRILKQLKRRLFITIYFIEPFFFP